MPTKSSIMKQIADKMNVPFSNKPTTNTVDNSDTGIPMPGDTGAKPEVTLCFNNN